MTNVEYEFHVSEKRKIRKMILSFSQKEFFHLAGLQHLNKNIRDRICELQYLEEYLDTNNIIKIFSVKDTPFLHSDINADYVIESSLLKRSKTVYIFLKERKEQPGVCCIVSFFVKKKLTYGGAKLYWMLKRKVIQGQTITLYQHENYNESSAEQVGKDE